MTGTRRDVASAVYSQLCENDTPPSNLDENEYPGEKTRLSSIGMQHRPNSLFELAPSEDRVYVCAWCPEMDAILGYGQVEESARRMLIEVLRRVDADETRCRNVRTVRLRRMRKVIN